MVNLTVKAYIFQKVFFNAVRQLQTDLNSGNEQPLTGPQISHIPSVDVIPVLYSVCKSPVTFNHSLLHLSVLT